jgi:hypothetical protein
LFTLPSTWMLPAGAAARVPRAVLPCT